MKIGKIIEGRAHKFGDNINTDYIIPGKYKFKTINEEELSLHLMEGVRPGFYKDIIEGDIIVGGENFGCGSSREQAVIAIKASKISAVVAKSFARIFYRNCINNGFLSIEADTDKIHDKDRLVIDLEKHCIYNKTQNMIINFNPLPRFVQGIISAGGLIEYLKINKDLV